MSKLESTKNWARCQKFRVRADHCCFPAMNIYVFVMNKTHMSHWESGISSVATESTTNQDPVLLGTVATFWKRTMVWSLHPWMKSQRYVGWLRGTSQQWLFSFFVKQVLCHEVLCSYSKEGKNLLDEKGVSSVQEQTM